MLFGSLPIEAFDHNHLRLLITGWRHRYAHNTVVTSRKYLAMLTGEISAAGGIPNLRKLIPKIGGQRPRTQIASPEEIAALRLKAKPWLDAAILLAVHAGLRRSDLLAITPAAYDPATLTITIRMKKTGRSLTVPASIELQSIFASLANSFPHTPVLELLKGSRVTPTSLASIWQRTKKRAGVDRKLWMHDLRRTLAVSLYELTKDLRLVEQMLGHTSLSSTINYLEHRDPSKLKPYFDALNKPVGRLVQ